MTNSNCLANTRCHQCGNEEHFHISGYVMAYVTDDGADAADNASINWDFDSYTECPDCNTSGPLSHFIILSK